MRATYVFDVRARVDGDDIAVLHAEVVANNTVEAGASVVEIVVSQDDEYGVLSLLALHQDSVATEELERLHGVVREGDNRVVIIGGIGDAAHLLASCKEQLSSRTAEGELVSYSHQRVRLLLLLQDGRGDLILRVVS